MHISKRALSGLFAVACLVLFCQMTQADGPSEARGTGAPDVEVFSLDNFVNYGAAAGFRGYAIGTTSCNVGDQPLNWCNDIGGCGLGTTAKDHPVIAQNMYRLKDGRLDQVGASWLKHGFTSLNQQNSACGTCQQPPLGGNQLGVGCVDPYTASLNGSHPLGRKSEVNAATGDFTFPFTQGGATGAPWNQRIKVAESDLAAASNPGARYFVEGHYIAPDDALAGNALNNASYREVSVNSSTFNLSFVGSTVRQKAAIQAWKDIDPTVELINVDVPSVPIQRFHVARKVTQVSPTLWHYEYAVHNMNADRSANRLTVRFFGPTTFSGVGFHDVNAHSNEPFDTADWPGVTTSNAVEWQTPAFPSSPQDANAIRWGTMYNFWFDASRPPEEIDEHQLGLFKAGSPPQLVFLEGTPSMFEDGFED